MQFYTKNEKKKLQFYYQLLVDFGVTILLYIKVVCIVNIKQAWCVVVITSGNNTMLSEIS